jgi:mRNA interferase MazF
VTILNLRRGDVVLAQIPYTDLRGVSIRPALVLSQGPIGQDVVLVAISTVSRGTAIASDIPLLPSHSEFKSTGLQHPSVLRVHKLVTVELSVVKRRLGQIGPQLQAQVDNALRGVVGLP